MNKFQKTALNAMVGSLFVASGAFLGAPAFAADAAADAAAAAPAASDKDALSLDTIVVTAASAEKSKLETSLSVTDVKSELVEAMNPQSQAEILRLIPGMIVGDTAGPGGNANISVRGLPVTTGGSPFVQLQEDGLPTVLFGDIQFGNNDYWIRYDTSNTIEAVRGGSASTLASGAPGAVINYISDTGTKKGGVINLSTGIGYDLKKATFAAGGPLNDTWRFHMDGFFEQGHGFRDQGFNAQKGYQIKANVTKELEGGKGFVRFYIKALDDQAPTYSGYPVNVNAGPTSYSSISAYPGFDARNGSSLGVYNQTFNVMDLNTGNISQAPANGIHAQANAVGTEVQYDLGNGLKLNDKFRYTVMNGTFSTQFTNFTTAAGVLPPATPFTQNANGSISYNGSLVNGYQPTLITYAAGPMAGQAMTSGAINSGTQIHTNMRDMGNTANDVSLSDKFKFADGSKLSAKGGLFYFSQNIAQDWHPSSSYSTFVGSNPVPLNIWSNQTVTVGSTLATSHLNNLATTQLLTNYGVSGYNTAWGSGVARSYDMTAANTAPYLDLTYDVGSLQLNAGLRKDYMKVTGWQESASSATNYLSSGVSPLFNSTTPPLASGIGTCGTGFNCTPLVRQATLDPSTYAPINYDFSYSSYTLGALYLINDDTSVFARASRGGKPNTDRNTFSGYTNPDGSLNASGKQKTTDFITQQELGVKTRGYVAGGAYGFEATYFQDKFAISNFDLTQGATGTYYDFAYSAKGLEFEGSFKLGGFSAVGQFTYTKASIDKQASGANPAALAAGPTGIPPHGTPKYSWMISPAYSFGDATVGGVLQGQGETNVNDGGAYYAPAQMFADAFVNYSITKEIMVAVHVNNLFNTMGTNGQGNNVFSGSGGNAVLTTSAVQGRTTDLTLTVRF